MLKSFDRYVLKEIASPFAIGLLVYTFTLLIHNILYLSNILISRGATTATIIKILLYLLPDLLSFTIPMSTLMGVLAGLSRMSTDSEIVAFRTMGINNFRILKPVMVFSFMMWLFSTWLIMYVAPESNYRLSQLLSRVTLSRTLTNIKPRTFYRELPYYILYFNEVDSRTGEWENIFLYSMKKADTDSIILANRGKFIHKADEKESYIILKDAVVYGFKKREPEESFSQTFAFLREYIPDLFQLRQTRRGSQQIFPFLIESLKHEPNNVALALQFHKKFSLPFACLAFGFLALSLGISTKKGGKISGFIISLGIIFVYYTIITASRNLVLKKIVSPFTGMWAPNLFLVLIGVVLYYFTANEKTISWEKLISFFSSSRKRLQLGDKKVLFVVKVKKLKLRLVKIIDMYVFKRLFVLFFLIFLSLLSIFSIINIVELIDEAIKNNVAFIYILKYVVYSIPEYSSLFFPVSILTAVLLTFSLMSKNNEIIAVQVSGIGLHRLTLPVIIWGILISIVAFMVQENIAPSANQKAQDALNVVRNIRHQTNLEFNKNWIVTANNKFYFYNFFDKRSKKFVKFNIVELDDNFEMKKRIFSRQAQWKIRNELILKDGFERTFNEKLPVDYYPFKSKKEIVEDGRGIFTKKIAFSQFMNITELREYINYLKDNKSDSEKYEAKLYYKYAFPFSSLVMVLIAIPFSFMMGNKGTLYGIGIAVGISMIYWGAIGIFSALGSTTLLSPFISAFAPVFIFGAVSIYLFINIKT